MTAPKHSTSPPPSSQDRKVRRINDSKIQQFHGRSHSPAPEQSIGMSDSTRGTQHNPMEILSSPEPEPVRTSYTKKKQKYYAVAIGHGPGIYTNWDDAQLQVHGYPAAKHKSFATRAEAESWLKENMRTSDTALYSGTHFTTIKPERSMANQQFSAAMHSSSPPRYYEDLTAQTSQHVPKVNEVSLDPEPILKPEQQKVVDLILEGHNVFYTGSAGCGKSTILKAFVKQLTLHGKRVKIVAPTNLAALNVGGVTTWSFAGWTPDSMKKSLDTLMKNSHGIEVWERFDSTDVLVIDEISMVENLLFERLNHIMKASIGEKHGGGPFGGIQVIVTGDFCQLSPVRPFQYCIGCGWELIRDNKWRPKEYRCENKRCREDVFQDIDKWAFRSKAWEECDFKHINLTEIHRQSDKKFISILQRIRTDGVILKPHANILLNHTSETEGAIQLFARRDDVDRVNNENISKLPSDAITYKCVDHFNWKDHHRDDSSLEKNTRPGEDGTLAALKEHRYEVYVHLKEGMRIVLQANLEPSMGLVNGSQGTILGFEPFDEKRLPRKPENRTEAGAAGMNFTRGAHARYFEEQIKTFGKENKRQPWPIVKFDNGLERTIFADCTASELGNEEPFSLLSRTQIPLMAGYAITVHKSQVSSAERLM
jgi:ATP-dependent DNA helicase PIF1